MSCNIELHIILNGAYSVVQVADDINRKTSPDVSATLFRLLERGREKGVIVDLKGAERIDNMGASILIEAFELAEKEKHGFHVDRLELIAASGSMRRGVRCRCVAHGCSGATGPASIWRIGVTEKLAGNLLLASYI